MAVYTTIEDEELQKFLADYDTGELLSFKGIAEGVQNTNYLVHTKSDQYILTLYETQVNADELPFFLDLMHFLSRHDIHCPLPVADRAGVARKQLGGRPAALFTFLEGFSVNQPKKHHCLELGRALGHLHQTGLGFEGARENSLSLEGWRRLFDKCDGDGMNDIHPELQKLIANELAYLGRRWPADLPRGVIHADLFPDNVFFIGDKLSGLIDFYFACTDLLAYDLAICLNAWCFERDGGYNATLGRALIKGYQRQRELTAREIEALPLLARGASLRFLLTRVHDWLNTPKEALVRPHDPRDYIRRLRFHQNVAAAAEYGL